jgi:hypothetical membrane protein
MTPRRAAVSVLVLVALFWVAVVIAASVNTGYSHSRDYVSSLASVGADHAWLGVLALAAVGAAVALTFFLVRPVSRVAAVAVALAGAGFVFGAFARIRCAEGAAFCGVGDRQSADIENTRGYLHEGAVIGSSLLLVVAMTALGVALLRQGRRTGGIASLIAALATVVTLALVSGDTPGAEQRIWIAVMTLWVITVALSALMRADNPHPA